MVSCVGLKYVSVIVVFKHTIYLDIINLHEGISTVYIEGSQVKIPPKSIFPYSEVKKGAKIRNQESIQSSTTPDPGYHMKIVFVLANSVDPEKMTRQSVHCLPK